ncbi:hypothetical protein GJ496_002486 [Pomphorhynchus laevis]|nr:hypothetical protein GJ496_002486 [Pomphorhynchus laevis]
MNDHVLSEHVSRHLVRYGLEYLDKLIWTRFKEIIGVDADGITKRLLFAICGSLIGHFPVARWLRPCCSYLKRMVNAYQWDETLDKSIKVMLKEIVESLKKYDPVRGKRRYLDADVRREDVNNVVRNYIKCQSIDPDPIHGSEGELGGQDYLSIIDAEPSRFAIWKELKRMNAPEIISKLLEVFWERGFPGEIIADSATVFRAQEFREIANQNGIEVIYRYAYKPNINGIIERCHRTIKRMCARTLGSVQEIVFWYNESPKNGTNQATAPMSEVYK